MDNAVLIMEEVLVGIKKNLGIEDKRVADADLIESNVGVGLPLLIL
jgi:hypothetical protein